VEQARARLWRYVTLITSRGTVAPLDLSDVRGIRGRDADDFEALINDGRDAAGGAARRNCAGPPHLRDGGGMSERAAINNPRRSP